MRPAPRPRLDSWKTIAEHLGRNVRTVTRWADERGLPVHRVPGGKRQAVFAYTDEVDAWLTSQDECRSRPADSGEVGSSGSSNRNAFSKSALLWAFAKRKWGWIVACVAVVGLVWASNLILARGGTTPTLRMAGLVKLTDDLHPKSCLRTDGRMLYYTVTEGLHAVLMSVAVGGGAPKRIETPFSNVDLQDISADGRKLLVTSRQGIESDKPLWEMTPEGGSPRRVGDVACFLARWSPDGERIAFAKGEQLWVSDTNGDHAHLLASFEASIQGLLWAPDRDRVRIQVGGLPASTETLWDVPAETGFARYPAIPRYLTQSNVIGWTWFNNGREFAYTEADREGNSNLRVANGKQNPWAAKINSVDVPLDVGRIRELSAVGSGRDLYFVRQTAERSELLRFDKKSQMFQSFLPGVSAEFVSFSRDGQWMSYMDEATRTLWRSRADGSEPLRLTEPPMNTELSSWSPDGTRIAFMGKVPGGPWRIYLVGRSGGDIHEVVSGKIEQGAPSWSPNGKVIVYGKVYCQDTHTCGLRRIELDSGRDEPVEGSQGLRTARWSYDGKYIAALEPDRHELVVMNVRDGHWRVLADGVMGDDLSWSRNSEYIYADSPQGEKPAIERVRVRDSHRSVVVSLSSFQKLSGQMGIWFALAPDDSPIASRLINSSEIYALHLADR